MTPHPHESSQPLVVMRFTRQFSALIDTGISLIRGLRLLQKDVPPPFAEAIHAIEEEVAKGQTLSRAFAGRPEYFSPIYVKLIRAGEIGGILEETLSCLADALEQEWQLSRRVEAREGWSWRLFASDQPAPRDWADLGDTQRTLTLFLFCRLLSDLLSSGIPTRPVLETAADLLPVTQRDAVRAVAELLPPTSRKAEPASTDAETEKQPGIAAPLAQFRFLPPFVAELMLHGEQTGHLDAMMDKAAKVYHHQLLCELM